MTKKHEVGRGLEFMLIILVLGTTGLFFQLGDFRMVALNLFYLPIVLSGYYLGRASAGTLSLFCVLVVTIVATLDTTGFASYTSPVMIYLALTVWAGALGLTAILVGTLCDARAAKVTELHEAYLGVVEVLSRYLQGGYEQAQPGANPVVELSQAVGRELRLSEKEIDDIRIGVLLFDLGSVEITTRLIDKAVSTLTGDPKILSKHTFHGMDLVHSLATVVHGVTPLLINQHDDTRRALIENEGTRLEMVPLAAWIIRTVRAYDAMTRGGSLDARLTPAQALEQLRSGQECNFHPEVLRALERIVRRSSAAKEPLNLIA